MASQQGVRVVLAKDGYYPLSFHWRGQPVRVLYVEAVHTAGLERRFRVRTVDGSYELSLLVGQGVWQMRHSPNALARAWARVQQMPRYPLPPARKRSRRRMPATREAAKPDVRTARAPQSGGVYAERLALVR